MLDTVFNKIPCHRTKDWHKVILSVFAIVFFCLIHSVNTKAQDFDRGPSFDCTKARTIGERLVCEDSGLSQADLRSAELYMRLRNSLPSDERHALLIFQRTWIRSRDFGCAVAATGVISAADRPIYIRCLYKSYRDHATELSAKLAEAGVVKGQAPSLFREPIYADRNWRLVSEEYIGRYQAMTIGDAKARYRGQTQQFEKGRAEGPFLNCPNGGRQLGQRYLPDVEAVSDEDLKQNWLEAGVKLDGKGLFVVSMKCGIPGTSSYSQLEFVQLGDNSAAYFALDGILFMAVPMH